MSLVGRFMKKGAKGIVLTTVTAAAVSLIANVLDVPQALVTSVLAIGVPLIMRLISDEPLIQGKVFDEVKKERRRREDEEGFLGAFNSMVDSVTGLFGGRDEEQERERMLSEAEKEYHGIFGATADALNKVIADETGASVEQVDGIMSLFMKPFIGVLTDEDPQSADDVGDMSGEAADEEEKNNPTLIGLTKRVLS